MFSCKCIRPLIHVRFAGIRNYKTSCNLLQENIKISGSLKKMMDKANNNQNRSGKKRSRSKLSKLNQDFLAGSNSGRSSSGPSEGSKRRAHNVSFVLYDSVTQIINSGELCPKIADMMIEITHVKMLPDFSAIHIYWASSGTERDQMVNILFKEKEAKMRALLTDYRPISTIPPVMFVKDKDINSQLNELNRLFEIADYGKDYIPTFRKSSQPEPIVHTDDEKAKQFQEVVVSFDESETQVIHMHSKDRRNVLDLEEKKNTTENFKHHGSDLNKSAKCPVRSVVHLFRDDMYKLKYTEIINKLKSQKPGNQEKKTILTMS